MPNLNRYENLAKERISDPLSLQYKISVADLNSTNDTQENTILVTDIQDGIKKEGLSSQNDEALYLEQTEQGDLELNLNGEENLATASLFLNQKNFVKSGSSSNVEAKASGNFDLSNDGFEKIILKNKYDFNDFSPLPMVKISAIVDDSNSLFIPLANSFTNTNNATKYYTYSQSDTMRVYTDLEGKSITISDETPTIKAILRGVSDVKVTLTDSNLNEFVVDKKDISITDTGEFSYTPSSPLPQGQYLINITSKDRNGVQISSSAEFIIDTQPIGFENISINEDVLNGGYLINFELLNFTKTDKIENIKAYIQNYDTNGELLYSNPINLTQNQTSLSAKYNQKLNLGDVIRLEATDAAGTLHVHTNEILIPSFTQVFNDHNMDVNTAISPEKFWSTILLSDSGFKPDGSRIIINDDKPYFRAILPDTTSIGSELIKHKDMAGYVKPTDIEVMARDVDANRADVKLDFEAIERPTLNTPRGYVRLTGFVNSIGAPNKRLEDGMYELYIRGGSYHNGDEWLRNSVKFTIDANAPEFQNSSVDIKLDPVRNKSVISGKILDKGVSESYKLKDHFSDSKELLQDSLNVYKNDGTKLEKSVNLTMDDEGNFKVEYDGEISEGGFYLALKDIAKNTIVTGNNNSNTIKTEGGNDIINAMDGDNVIDSGRGDDIIVTGSGNDIVKSSGDIYDVMKERPGYRGGGIGDDDIISTGAGDDYIDGGYGRDEINAGSGDDTVVINFDPQRHFTAKSVDAGEGVDTILLNPTDKSENGPDTIDLSRVSSDKFKRLKNFEKIDLAGSEKGVELKGLDARDILDLDDARGVVFKFEGDGKDKIYLKEHFSKMTDQTGVESGYERYGNNVTSYAAENSVVIDINKDIITDFT